MSNIINTVKEYIQHITWHWTAGNWTWTSEHYHFNVKYNAATKKAEVVQTLSLMKKGSHVWKRNTGNIGISFCAMVNSKFPVMDAQVEAMAKLTAELCYKLGLSIDKCNDHVYWATMDGYGPGSGSPETRIDIGALEPIVKKKARWYLAKITSGEMTCEYTNNLF